MWGTLAVACYVGPPLWMIQRGAGWFDAPLVWASSFGALFALFVIQTVVAERKRYQGRAPASATKPVRRRKG